MATRIDALNNALAGNLTDEDREIIRHMIDSLSKPRPKSKAAIENEKLAIELVRAMRAANLTTEDCITTAWVMEHLNGIRSGQKAAKVLAVAINNGDVVRIEHKHKAFYHLAA